MESETSTADQLMQLASFEETRDVNTLLRCKTPFLIWRWEGRQELFPLPDRRSVLVGRLTENDLVLPCGAVSREHCRLIQDGETWSVIDEDSTHGTIVNDHSITAPKRLADRDVLLLGSIKLVYRHRAKVAPLAPPTGERTPPIKLPLTVSQGQLINALCEPLLTGKGRRTASDSEIADSLHLTKGAVSKALQRFWIKLEGALRSDHVKAWNELQVEVQNSNEDKREILARFLMKHGIVT